MISITDLKMQKVDLAGAPGLQDTKPTSVASLFLTGKNLQYSAAFNCCLQKKQCYFSKGGVFGT